MLFFAVSGLTLLFVSLFALERCYPLRILSHSLFHRLILNASISVLAFLAAALVMRPAIMHGLGWSAEKELGILHLLPEVFLFRFFIGFLLLDLSFYLWHRANHQVPFLWRFHNVHHIDPDLDVSTAFRFHFGEIAFSAVFQLVQLLLIGPSFLVFMLYEIAFHANTLFHHSNIRLPIQLERVLNKFLVTPRMHGIHHSSFKNENNSNFSVIIPWWDSLARTLLLNIPQPEIIVGVPGYSDKESQTFLSSITMPFKKQRDYWRADGGEMIDRAERKAEPPWFLAE